MEGHLGDSRKKRKIPYENSTVNVGVQEEMESRIDLILKEASEIVNLAHKRGGVTRTVKPFGESRRA